MSISRETISEMVYDVVRDTTFNLAAEKFIDFAILDLNRARPLINIEEHEIEAADILTNGGMMFDLPTGFDIAKDKIVNVELLDEGNYETRTYPNYIKDFWIYNVSTGVSKLRFVSEYKIGDIFKIYWRSSYSFDTELGSNIPDSLTQPLVLSCAYHYARALAMRYAQAKAEGGDAINFISNKQAMQELADGLKKDFDILIKELPDQGPGVVPDNTPESKPSRMRQVY